jgi:hypothetical protein
MKVDCGKSCNKNGKMLGNSRAVFYENVIFSCKNFFTFPKFDTPAIIRELRGKGVKNRDRLINRFSARVIGLDLREIHKLPTICCNSTKGGAEKRLSKGGPFRKFYCEIS